MKGSGMEFREPPQQRGSRASSDRIARGLLVGNLLLLMVVIALMIQPRLARREQEEAARVRDVAAKLQAAGALEEAAALYAQYLKLPAAARDTSGGLAYSVAMNYLDSGDYRRALRWLYEAESIGVAPELEDELASRIVECLERLGRHHVAQAALERRVRLDADSGKEAESGEGADVVLARIGSRTIARSEVERALDDLPPQLAAAFAGTEGRRQFLQRFVAEELLWSKARKLGIDSDPEVLRQHEEALRGLAVAHFVETEVVEKIHVDEADLRNYHAAHSERYSQADERGDEVVVPFEDVRSLVERDYRREKVEAAYSELIDSELAVQDVELYPERWGSEN